MPQSSRLFEPLPFGRITLANRIAMAPLTRNRAGAGNVPTDLAVTYYAQRATAGLIVSEATQIMPEGQGYQDTPGIHTPEQIAGWRKVTDAVHAAGGRIVLQMWHVGRVSHVSLQPGGQAPVAPSAIRAQTKTFVGGTFADVSEPRALRRDELPGIVQAYRVAARNAIDAGFDGVEVHGANGYLLDQFLRRSANQRTDDYGGSIENRARLLLEVCAAVAGEIGADRTGVRLSPTTPSNDVSDPEPQPLFNYTVEQLDRLNLLFLHVIEGATGGARDAQAFDHGALRQRFRGTYIANNGYTGELAADAVAAGRADMVAFGRPFVANPDLVARLRTGAPLAELDRETLYGGGAKGYTDYPALAATA